jgi:Na+/H+ antiporter NhaD/arsenite permease-like protein
MVSLVILIAVFVLIAVRQVGRFRFQIWQVMLLGAIGVLATRQIPLLEALKAINLDVILFLFGVFIIGQAVECSGYLTHLSYQLFRKAQSVDTLILSILFGAGMLSTLLMNDTVAIIGTPLALLIAQKNSMPPTLLLLTLAFAITIGSVTSPIGNPQNLLVAINGHITNPFITFARFLFLPTIINLFIAYLVLRAFYRKHFHREVFTEAPGLIADPKLAKLTKVSLVLLISLIGTKVAMVFLNVPVDFKLTYIALGAALPIIASRERATIIKNIDWHTLIFFAAMFILMASVWNSGFFQKVLNSGHLDLTSTSVILGISVVLSQFISNVPMVALYLPTLMQAGGIREMMALAAGSTIAGNLSILGAASNVIIIQNAEKKSGETLTFLEFIRVGLPLTAINTVVYWVFLRFTQA